MTKHVVGDVSAHQRLARSTSAFTLLEVLVSLGIIIGALAGIAALLPAAGSRLGEATEIDRAGTLAENAHADLTNRQLFAQAIWTGSSTPAVVFGQGLTGLVNMASATSSVAVANLGQPPDFFLQDDGISGGQPNICYGCMLSSTLAPPRPPRGARVRATTVVFRKPAAELKAFTLVQAAAGSSVFQSGSGADAAADRSRFLAGCSWVLAMSSTTTVPAAEPLWVPIASSWTAYPPGVSSGAASGESFVTLTGTNWIGLLSGTTLRVVGFDGVLRVQERFVTLD